MKPMILLQQRLQNGERQVTCRQTRCVSSPVSKLQLTAGQMPPARWCLSENRDVLFSRNWRKVQRTKNAKCYLARSREIFNLIKKFKPFVSYQNSHKTLCLWSGGSRTSAPPRFWVCIEVMKHKITIDAFINIIC